MAKLDHLSLAKVTLQEEMGEVLQALGKIDRFGLRSINPATGNENLVELGGELGDLLGALWFLVDEMTDSLNEADQDAFHRAISQRQTTKRENVIRLNERMA